MKLMQDFITMLINLQEACEAAEFLWYEDYVKIIKRIKKNKEKEIWT